MHRRITPGISRLKLLFLASMSLIISTGAFAQSTRSSLADDHVEQRIAGLLNAFHKETGLPGATIGYVLPDGTGNSVSVGFADKDREIPMRKDHRLMAGSTGKTFFAALALQLVDEGKLDLEGKISQWLGDEEWFDRLPNANDITLRMLMNHTSGWPRYIEQPALVQAIVDDPDIYFQPGEQLSYIYNLEPLFPAGEDWAYSDTNYIAVALIIEKVTGDSCYNLIHQRILRPNELWDIIPTVTRDLTGMACGYVNVEANLFQLKQENVIQQGRFVFNPQMEWGGGGFASTPGCLARWADLLYSGDILSSAMKKEMRTTVEAKLGPGSRYGLGLMQRSSDLGLVIGHSGYFPGYLTDMSYYADYDLTLAFQVNTTVMSRELNPRAIQKFLDECANMILGSD